MGLELTIEHAIDCDMGEDCTCGPPGDNVLAPPTDERPVSDDEAEEKALVPKLASKDHAPTFGKDRTELFLESAHTLGLTGLVVKRTFRPYAELAVLTYQALYDSAFAERGKVTAGEQILLSHAALQTAMSRYIMALGITRNTHVSHKHMQAASVVMQHAAASLAKHSRLVKDNQANRPRPKKGQTHKRVMDTFVGEHAEIGKKKLE